MGYQMTIRRKLAIASWDAPREGNIYGKLTINTLKVSAYLERARKETGEKITITHFIGKAMGEILAKRQDLNGQIVLGNYRPHNKVRITFLVQIDEGEDLAKVRIDDVDKKSLSEISKELRAGATKLRTHTDKEYEKSKVIIRLLPTWMIKPLISLTGYLTGVLGVDAKIFGLESYPFGSCIITSVGMLGLDEGYAPPTPFARVPIYIAIQQITDRPVVENGEIVVRPMINIMATIDHRFLDGFQGGVIAKTMRDFFEHPEKIPI